MALKVLKMICPNPECLAITYIDPSVSSRVNKYVKCVKCGSLYNHG